MTNHIEQALVFFGSGIVLVPIFNRLGFGSVLGYLIAGMLVGPFGFKFINDPNSVLHFAELGVVLLLFMIGLEIRPARLWQMRYQLLGLGGLQILLTTGIFAGILLFLNLSFVLSIILGFALSLSSTAFAVQTLTEKGEFDTEFGKGSFSILLMQDLFAIPALALIPSILGPTAGDTHLGSVAIFLVIFLIVSFLISRFLFKPLFRMIASSSREMFTAATLFIVLGVAAIMLRFGLSAALGTFIAGVLLADSEYRHELEADLNPFKSLLMGLFFIAVGMSVSLDLIFSRPFFILGLAVLYISVKFIIIYALGRCMKHTHETSKTMASYVSQGGEFAFVIFGVLNKNIVPGEMIELLTAIITISMAISPILDMLLKKMSSFKQSEITEPNYDKIHGERPEIIIAGLGRFGQIFARILRAQNIPFVSIDHDSDQIEYLRKFGNIVYYGDVSRIDILESAGAKQAKYLVLAIDDVEVSLKAARKIREHFPHLKIFARARNRGHVFELMELGITHIKRETFDSSLNFVGELFKEMGHAEQRIQKLLDKFAEHDSIMLEEQYKVRTDDKMFVSVSKQGMTQLAQVLEEESQQSYIQLSK